MSEHDGETEDLIMYMSDLVGQLFIALYWLFNRTAYRKWKTRKLRFHGHQIYQPKI